VAINNSKQTPEQINAILRAYEEGIDQEFRAKGTTIGKATPAQIDQVRAIADRYVLTKRRLMLSEGIYKDLLNDVNGGGLHRVQIIICTINLGLMFLWTVGTTLRMPEFDTVLLALIGLSAGTYIGLKIPER
jgi:hypothetical protein